MGKAQHICVLISMKGDLFLEQYYLGTQSFLSVWQPPGAQTGSWKNLHPYGKSLAYFIHSVDLLKMLLSLD